MIPELGHFALIIALCLAIVQGVVPLVGAQRGVAEWMLVAVPAAKAQFVFVLIAFGCLMYAFIVRDFSVLYVATNSNSALPVAYRVAAVWGAHEGSLLLWALILAMWTFAVAALSGTLPLQFRARVVAVMGLVSIGFLLFMLTTSNPFARLLPAPMEGRDLNPLLQDPGLVIHPPLLYMGYVGLVVPFSFAIAALLEGRVDALWTRWSRPWTALAWVFLTSGIALGSWWAYYELGWGGWWFWDPVENASFMPWLVATALIHSLAVTEQRNAFKAWTVLLAIFAFSLSLLGTFLVRSGVLVSVHAFASDPERGLFILIFLVIVVGGALSLYAWRARQITDTGTFQLLSRETLLLCNNVLLVVSCASILLGTLYPLILDALQLGKISVGPPYFDRVFVPLMLPLAVLLGLGPFARWRKDSPAGLARRMRLSLIGTVALFGLAAVWLGGKATLMTLVGILVAIWVAFSTVQLLVSRLVHKRRVLDGVRRLPRAVLGMALAHLGVAVFIVGVTLTTSQSVERDVRLAPGQKQTLAGYEFEFEGTANALGPNYTAERGTIVVNRDGRPIATLYPEKRHYPIQEQPMTEAAIAPGLTRDLYVALGEAVDGGSAWTLRLYVKPFIRWIWLGALMMALGGLIAATDRRYRILATASSAKPASDGQAEQPTPELAH